MWRNIPVKMATLRWGIAGAGSISDDFAAAVRTLSKHGHNVVAVAARDNARAAAFASKFSIAKSYGSYEELSRDADVDVVYVGTVNSTHYEVAKLMLNANKHVLCEKSLTLLIKHSEELFKLAAKKKKFFQEAVWSRFFPAYDKLREHVANGVIGDVKLISINFCKKIPTMDKKATGSGALFGLGVYPIQLVLAICGPDMPVKIQACGSLSADGADLSESITLQYKSGAVAQLTNSLEIGATDAAAIFGTKGSIIIPRRFHAPTEIIVNGQTETFPYPVELQPALEKIKRPGFIYQAQEVRDCLEKGLLFSPRMTQQESLTIAAIMEEIKAQIGLDYSDLY